MICRSTDKATGMTVYVDIAGSEVGQPVAVEFQSEAAKMCVPAQIATD